MLQVRQVQKRYGALTAVKSATFEVARGERFGLLGPNGAGKTTTISILTGTLDPDAGSVMLDGLAVSTTAMDAKRRIGYVPQEIALYDDLDARSNLRFFGALYGLSGKASETASDRALEVTGLTDRASDAVKTYSGGMKRRLNIAAALLHDPDLMVLDEPTVGVDPQSRNAIFETLLALASLGKTLIYTTHYMEEVERLCQRVAVMDHGEVIAQGTLAELNQLLPASDRVTLEVDQEITTADLPGTRNLAIEGRKVVFEVSDLGRDLPSALSALSNLGIRVLSIKSETPSLEEVFLHLTGRTLRD